MFLRVFYTCSTCKRKVAHDFVGYSVWPRRPNIGCIGDEGYIFSLDKGLTISQDHNSMRCCGQRMKIKYLRFEKTERKLDCPCDPRCTNAISEQCYCSCGGQNHGAKHLVVA